MARFKMKIDKLKLNLVLLVKWILEVSGDKELLASNKDIRESILLRERIVLPLVTIQQFGLQQLRKNPDQKEYQKLVIRSMFGIINAARNAA